MPANNGAVQTPLFQPAMRVISAITNANPAQVTTTFDHNFLSTDICRIRIPDGFGMEQLNGFQGQITVTGATTFTIDIDAINFDAFVVPGSSQQYAQVIPIGENNSTLYGATDNTAPSYAR